MGRTKKVIAPTALPKVMESAPRYQRQESFPKKGLNRTKASNQSLAFAPGYMSLNWHPCCELPRARHDNMFWSYFFLLVCLRNVHAFSSFVPIKLLQCNESSH